MILEFLLYEKADRDLEFCKDIGATELRNMLIRNNKNPDAWKVTLEKLKLTYYKVDYKTKECPWSVREFRNEYWFPNSAQLRDVFGLDFHGSVCADNPPVSYTHLTLPTICSV